MFRTSKGFTLVETLVAVSILFVSLIIIIPSFVVIQKEREELYNDLAIIESLRTEMIHLDHTTFVEPTEFFRIAHGKKLVYRMSKSNGGMKGCVTWENDHSNERKFCLFKDVNER